MIHTMFRFRVLVEYSRTYSYWAATCLETGNVATANDETTARTMIGELVSDEIEYCWNRQSLKNLCSCPAPMDSWLQWFRLAETTAPALVELHPKPRWAVAVEPTATLEIVTAPKEVLNA